VYTPPKEQAQAVRAERGPRDQGGCTAAGHYSKPKLSCGVPNLTQAQHRAHDARSPCPVINSRRALFSRGILKTAGTQTQGPGRAAAPLTAAGRPARSSGSRSKSLRDARRRPCVAPARTWLMLDGSRRQGTCVPSRLLDAHLRRGRGWLNRSDSLSVHQNLDVCKEEKTRLGGGSKTGYQGTTPGDDGRPRSTCGEQWPGLTRRTRPC
jgi:hypothetical protein